MVIINLVNICKIHIKNQVKAGATIIQIFDSWAGLLENNIPEYIYIPTLSLVEYTKSLGVPALPAADAEPSGISTSETARGCGGTSPRRLGVIGTGGASVGASCMIA